MNTMAIPRILFLISVASYAIIAFLFAALAIRRARRRSQTRWIRRFFRIAFADAAVPAIAAVIRQQPDLFLAEYARLFDTMQPSAEQRQRTLQAVESLHLDVVLMRQLLSRSRYRRCRAASRLAHVDSERVRRALIYALEREPHESVRTYIAFALTRSLNPVVLPVIIDTLSGATLRYQKRVHGLIERFGAELVPYFEVMENRTEPEIRRLFIRVAATQRSARMRGYLERVVKEAEPELSHEAFRVLVGAYSQVMDLEPYLAHHDNLIRNLAVEALGDNPSEQNMERVLPFLTDPSVQKSAIVALSTMTNRMPRLYPILMNGVGIHSNPDIQAGLLEVLANRVEYLLERLIAHDESQTSVSATLARLLEAGYVNAIIGFLNRNEDTQAETRICGTIGEQVRNSSFLTREFARYAKGSVQEALHLQESVEPPSPPKRNYDTEHQWALLTIFLMVVMLPPLCTLLFSAVQAPGRSLSGSLRLFVTGFTWFFSGYTFILQLWYLVLLAVSGAEVVRQQAYQDLKPLSMLFQPGMLPSISIVAPAFREEATIVESVNSLLNLRYPEYEVIVVNDGSTDRTLDVLVDHFELERIDVFIHGYLNTRPVRGVYRNPRIPELTVIDKVNGGKADSLNAGINAARADYFAAIDSDSLLERDALLRLAGAFLDSDRPVVAAGGSILPVNGCRVTAGSIDEFKLPRSPLASLQTMEYIRSFLAGRTGWARLRSLLIVSGAFGLFSKQEVIDARGYLTSSEQYTRDTVAEDMELVVRIYRRMREENKPFAIQYSYNANCWTEVPESTKILTNQRDRWQRGLIDIVLYHSRMLFSRKYGPAGLIAFPYYLIFEVIGPWIEAEGYLLFILSLAVGILPPAIISVVLFVTVVLGTLTSLCSLLLVQWKDQFLSPLQRLSLVLLALAENLGYRQYNMWLRVRGFSRTLRGAGGWGSMVRRGFSVDGGKKG